MKSSVSSSRWILSLIAGSLLLNLIACGKLTVIERLTPTVPPPTTEPKPSPINARSAQQSPSPRSLEGVASSTPVPPLPEPTQVPQLRSTPLEVHFTMEAGDCGTTPSRLPEDYTALKMRKSIEERLPRLQNAVLVDVTATCIDLYGSPGDKESITFPVVTGWKYLYRAGDKLLEVSTRADGVVDLQEKSLEDFYRDSAAIEGWVLDSDEVIKTLQDLKLPMRDSGWFRVHTWPINGINRAAWTVPYHLGDQSVFIVDASSGQILCPLEREKQTYQECVIPNSSGAEATSPGLQLVTATPEPQSYTITINTAPPYYKGTVPFTYTAVVDPQQHNAELAHVFSTFRTDFSYKNKPSPLKKLATGARTVDAKTGELLAEASLAEEDTGGYWIEETHFANGKAVFRARSHFSSETAFKDDEQVVEGTKRDEYYFIWTGGVFAPQ
jgi:hypothetical protein